MSVGRANPRELDELARIAKECGLCVDFPAELARSYAAVLVLRRAELPLGFAVAWRAADELHVIDVGITLTERRRGLGRMLMQALRGAADEQALRVVLLEVRESNRAAIALYESEGFAVQGRRERYYSDTGEAAVVMELLLR